MQKTYLTSEMLVTIDDVCLFVQYDYEDGEPEVYYSDGSGHPGSPAWVEVIDVFAGEVSIFNLLSDAQIEEIKIQILESYD